MAATAPRYGVAVTIGTESISNALVLAGAKLPLNEVEPTTWETTTAEAGIGVANQPGDATIMPAKKRAGEESIEDERDA